jgi:hypothetical protein
VERIDRRAFMHKAGVAGATAGALWVAPSVLGSSSAWAAGSCVHTGGLAWSTTTFAGTSTPSTSGAVTFTATLTTAGSPTTYLVVTVTPTTPNPGVGTGSGGSSNTGGVDQAVPYPNTPAPAGLNGVTSYYVMNMRNSAANRGYTVKFDFWANAAHTVSQSVYNLSFALIDIDTDSTSGNQYKDNVWLDTAGYLAPLPSEVTGSGTSTSPWTGNGTAGVQDATGTVKVTYPKTQGIHELNVSYQSGNAAGGIQYVGIGDLTWCY